MGWGGNARFYTVQLDHNRWTDVPTDGWMDGQLDGWTDGWTDRWMDKASFRVSCPQLKRKESVRVGSGSEGEGHWGIRAGAVSPKHQKLPKK